MMEIVPLTTNDGIVLNTMWELNAHLDTVIRQMETERSVNNEITEYVEQLLGF